MVDGSRDGPPAAIGMLRIRFAHVWHHIRELLQALAERWPSIVPPPFLGSLRNAFEATLGVSPSALVGASAAHDGASAAHDDCGDGRPSVQAVDGHKDGDPMDCSPANAPATANATGDFTGTLDEALYDAWAEALQPAAPYSDAGPTLAATCCRGLYSAARLRVSPLQGHRAIAPGHPAARYPWHRPDARARP